jgi:hypothetical protein
MEEQKPDSLSLFCCSVLHSYTTYAHIEGANAYTHIMPGHEFATAFIDCRRLIRQQRRGLRRRRQRQQAENIER